MTDYTNYSTSLATMSGSVATIIAGLVKLDSPKISNKKINTTNHGSNGHTTFISGSLLEIDDFKATLSFEGTDSATLYSALIAGTMGSYRISFPNSKTWSFSALVTEFQPEGADAQSPEMLQYSVTFSPSGSMVVA
jgi:hypothetical protein